MKSISPDLQDRISNSGTTHTVLVLEDRARRRTRTSASPITMLR